MQKVNPRYRAAKETTARYRVIFGGTGSGKSVFTMQDELDRAARHGVRTMIFRKVQRTSRVSTFQLAQDVISAMNWGGYCNIKSQEMRIDFPYSGGSLIFAGVDDPEKLKSLAGIDRVWMEEASEFSEKDFSEIDRRVRGKGDHPKQLTLTLNPVHPQLWVRLLLVDRVGTDQAESPPADEVFVLKTTYRDNLKHLSEADVRMIQRFKGVAAKIYAEGEWAIDTTLLIYPEWEFTNTYPATHEAYGLDYGFGSPSSFVRVDGSKEGRFYVEELLYQQGLTHADLGNRISRIPGIDKDTPMYVDSAEPELIELLYGMGFNAKKAEKAVTAGIMAVKARDLYLVEGSTNLAKELYAYSWEQDREGNRIDKPVKKMDHAADAMRYAVLSHFGPVQTSWVIN